jgi:hypothetical protein
VLPPIVKGLFGFGESDLKHERQSRNCHGNEGRSCSSASDAAAAASRVHDLYVTSAKEVTGSNIFADESLHMRILDWAEATISHPFAGLVNTFRDIAFGMRLQPNGREVIRLRATYLEPWTPFASTSELNRLFERGYLLGMLCRAEVWRRIMATQSIRTKYGSYARIWLQFFRQAATIGVSIGGPR